MIHERIAPIRAVILDVDGVLTDGSITIDPTGRQTQRFNVRDGAAIKWMARSGFIVAFLSGRSSDAVSARARELGVRHIVQGATDKLAAYEALKEELGVSDQEVCYMGDDLHDLPVLRRAGFAATVADAVEEVREAVHYVTETAGGRGAVRELAEIILKSRDLYDELTERYRT